MHDFIRCNVMNKSVTVERNCHHILDNRTAHAMVHQRFHHQEFYPLSNSLRLCLIGHKMTYETTHRVFPNVSTRIIHPIEWCTFGGVDTSDIYSSCLKCISFTRQCIDFFFVEIKKVIDMILSIFYRETFEKFRIFLLVQSPVHGR